MDLSIWGLGCLYKPDAYPYNGCCMHSRTAPEASARQSLSAAGQDTPGNRHFAGEYIDQIGHTRIYGDMYRKYRDTWV